MKIEPVIKKCENCGEEFMIKIASLANKRKFCSPACSAAFNKQITSKILTAKTKLNEFEFSPKVLFDMKRKIN